MKFRTIINFNVSRTTFFLSFHFVHLSSICCVLTHLWPHLPTSLETWNMKHSFKHNRPIIHPLRLLVCRVDRQDLGVNDAPRHWPSLFLTQKIQINENVVPPPPTRVLIFFCLSSGRNTNASTESMNVEHKARWRNWDFSGSRRMRNRNVNQRKRT